MTRTAQQAAAILERHRAGWRFHIGWPSQHQPQQPPAKAGNNVGHGDHIGRAWRATTAKWITKHPETKNGA